MTAPRKNSPNIKPADALPEWFNDLTKPRRAPVSKTPVMVLIGLAFSTGACLALLILGVAI